ncbi:Response regulator receiver domain-containing protein [Rhizobium sp. NFR07]|uniref:response regulator n=1 Tax=Rhizobium sp. NFR07 TaxID=1566262 RepID=UPI0008E9796A|nr:response regulator [Rhizobium sp. NFR07]SFB59079.1 Response regulator receiver domain-containing protein [Rhizobium sp. NFR07]
MSEVAKLDGKKILIVEDEFFLAVDTAQSLEDAGAHVLGPCGNKDEALRILAEHSPSAALLDINLGDGSDFTVAEALAVRGIPFVFMTGYDLELIPPQFAGVARLQKPMRLRQIVDALETII